MHRTSTQALAAPLALVHTAAVHVARFDALLAAQAPGLAVRHWVDAPLLALAQALGAEHPQVVARTQALMQQAAEGGARVVVCTCSTVGAAAEATPTGGHWLAHRVDRAMADQAVLQGPQVLLVAALASTLAPTTALLLSSARRLGQPVQVRTLLVAPAWALFEAGDTAGYLACVGAAVRQVVGEGMGEAVGGGATAPGQAASHATALHAVLLAQASMADLAPQLADLPLPVLSSPDTGLAKALDSLATLAHAGQTGRQGGGHTGGP